MDGNGRWARSRGLPRLAGHQAGVENLRRVLRATVEFGVQVLTIYAFSTENWGRPKDEVEGLMNILERVIDRELDELDEEGVQLRHIGRLEGVPPHLKKRVLDAIEQTRDNRRLILNVAFNYGGRAELVDAMRSIIRDGVPADASARRTGRRSSRSAERRTSTTFAIRDILVSPTSLNST